MRGPLNSPQRLDHWGQYEAIFGGFAGGFRMAPAIYSYFANGGKVCYAVRVADTRSPARRPERAKWTMLRGDGTPVVALQAADEGSWGNDISLAMHQAREPMVLTRLAEPAEGPRPGTDIVVRVESTADLYPRDPAGLGTGSPIVLVHAEDSQIRFPVEVSDIGSGGRLHLRGNLRGVLPAQSLVLGYGIDLELRSGDRLERFESLSLNPDHPRYIVQALNGPEGLTSYVDRLESGHSILARVAMPVPSGESRPFRGVDVGAAVAVPPTFAEPVFPENLQVQLSLEGNDERWLVCSGAMTDADRERLFEQPTDAEYRAAIDALYEQSQTFRLELPGRDASRPIEVGFFTGYSEGGYFPETVAGRDDLQGLAALEAVDEIGLVAIPDLADGVSPVWLGPWGDHLTAESIQQFGGSDAYVAGQRQMLRHCRVMGERFAILDAPLEAGSATDPAALLVPDYIESLAFDPGAHNGALYFPWVRIRALGDHDSRELVPPCGLVAGVYARTEAREGVHLSPANEPLETVYELQLDLDNAVQRTLNDAGVNCLRVLPGAGIRIWGARTLSRSPTWRYVAVRRTLLAIAREIRHRLGWAVFEPINADLRIGIAMSLRSYFGALFRNNVLAGKTPEEAFFIQCDSETTPNEAWERGEVTAKVGFAPLYPAEFVVVTVTRTAESVHIQGADIGLSGLSNV
jgi:hypothetical protein